MSKLIEKLSTAAQIYKSTLKGLAASASALEKTHDAFIQAVEVADGATSDVLNENDFKLADVNRACANVVKTSKLLAERLLASATVLTENVASYQVIERGVTDLIELANNTDDETQAEYLESLAEKYDALLND